MTSDPKPESTDVKKLERSAAFKRIILILGGKGGTGKTLHCRQLYYFLICAGVRCVSYDADIENPEFWKYHASSQHPVFPLDFLSVGHAKQFFTEIESEKPDVILIDMPGASGRATREQIDRFGMFAIGQQLGYRITLDTVLNNAYNTINSLELMMNFCGDRADYVAVKSKLWDEGALNFDRWDKSESRKQFQQLKGLEIEMPVLEASTFDAIHERNLSFFEREQLPFGDRILLDSFLDLSKPQLERAHELLGLPIKKLSTAK